MIDILVWFYIPRPFGALIALELLQDLGLRIALRLGVVHCTALGWCGIQEVCWPCDWVVCRPWVVRDLWLSLLCDPVIAWCTALEWSAAMAWHGRSSGSIFSGRLVLQLLGDFRIVYGLQGLRGNCQNCALLFLVLLSLRQTFRLSCGGIAWRFMACRRILGLPVFCCGLICWPMSRVVYHPWVAWVSSGLRCILNVWDPTYDVCVCGSAILQSLHNERRKTVQDRRLVLYSPAVRVPRLWWDSMIAWGMQSWIATWVVRSCF